jgi:hypothetical protein
MKIFLLAALSCFFLLPACQETKTKSKEKSTDDYRKKASENKPDKENGTGESDISEHSGSTKTDTTGEFDISAPSGWTKTDTIMEGQRIVFVKSPREGANDNFVENVNVLTEKIGSMQMDEYVDLSITNIKKGLTGFKQGKISDRSINGYEFKCLRYSHVYSGFPIDVDVYFTLQSGTAYIITCSAKGGKISEWESEFDEVIRSFRLN